MTTLITKIFDLVEWTEKHADPRVKDWLLMNTVWKPLIVILVYLYFVKKLGPEIMKNRQPLDIRKIMIVYNAVQILINAYLIKEAFRLLWLTSNYRFACIEINYSNTPKEISVARTVWMYHFSRFLDLLDTVFFVLRKKQQQVTFLHVYHHSLVFIMSWVVTKYYAGGHVAFFGTINSFVHAVMYTYYLLTALYPGYKNSLWWKKHLTQLQLIQFVVTGVHGVLVLFMKNCNFPKLIVLFGIPQDVFMFLLFWDFYKKAYWKNNKEIQQNNASKRK